MKPKQKAALSLRKKVSPVFCCLILLLFLCLGATIVCNVRLMMESLPPDGGGRTTTVGSLSAAAHARTLHLQQQQPEQPQPQQRENDHSVSARDTDGHATTTTTTSAVAVVVASSTVASGRGGEHTRTTTQEAPQQRNKASPPPRRTGEGAFVHIGKTAGSTLSVLLRDGCHSFMEHPCRRVVAEESAASRRITAYYHVPDFGLLSASHHQFYVVSVRDPYDRTISSFVYEHLANRRARNETIDDAVRLPKYVEAYRCFPTLQAFVDHLGYNPRKFTYNYSRRSVHADSCSDLASAALYGRVKLYNHLYFSMDRIRSFLPTTTNSSPPSFILYVTRQEHLWDDWTSVNQALGQSRDSVYIPQQLQLRNTNNNNNQQDDLSTTTEPQPRSSMPVQRTLSATGRMMLCNAIREEYRAYFWFLQHAQNLQPADVQESVERARRNCPIFLAADMKELLSQ